MDFKITLITIEKLDEAFDIILDAKKLLSKLSLQWQQGYPYKETIKKDIEDGNLYGCFDEEELVGIIALVKGFNPDYEFIDGKWEIETGHNDLTIHRIAVKENYHGKHVGDSMMNFAIYKCKEEGIKSIKADTHITNKAMQKLCLNAGMKYKGIIHLVRKEEDNSRHLTENNFRFAPIFATSDQLDSQHAKDENIFVSSLEPAVNFYKDLLKRL